MLDQDRTRLGSAALFPGQGGRPGGLRALVARTRPDLLRAAVAELGCDPFERFDEGTRFAQPAIYCAALAGWERIADEVDCVAGHSLGELTALVAAGSIDERDGLALAAARGRFTAACTGGRMLAVEADIATARALAARHGLSVANDNSPTQVVLAGAADALDRAAVEAKAAGRRARLLGIDGAFHSPAMRPAQRAFAAALAGVAIRPPRLPVFSSVTAAPFGDVRIGLTVALTNPVRWRETLLALRARGVERFRETGPGRALTGLARATLGDVDACTVERLELARA